MFVCLRQSMLKAWRRLTPMWSTETHGAFNLEVALMELLFLNHLSKIKTSIKTKMYTISRKTLKTLSNYIHINQTLSPHISSKTYQIKTDQTFLLGQIWCCISLTHNGYTFTQQYKITTLCLPPSSKTWMTIQLMSLTINLREFDVVELG